MRRQRRPWIRIALSGATASRRKARAKSSRTSVIPRSRLRLLGSKPRTIPPSIRVAGVVASPSLECFQGLGILCDVAVLELNPFLRKKVLRAMAEHSSRL